MAKKKVLFVCATGVATSTVVEEKVKEYCLEHGLDCEFDQRNVASVAQIGDEFDLIVATCQVPAKIKTPVVMGLPILMGFGAEKTYQEIEDILRS
ncbi:PTS sugar transporter subunit IIB [Collinsella sp. AGMB00827]|uniref:PTS sugar transporter subunit IIB n=1 Tax=Collinsella ureilytica TaxID=2869515 RepID=A0ABS7MJN6_9ACTN|nr:PTS sugar transporter subunit IIB [Collinsella urealyticum]MBY4797579.1 PTS sugar transporter subunit IIB [Collinsella urealyticum]